MIEWIYRNSMVEYEQRLRDIENERHARKVGTPRLQMKVLKAIISDLKGQLNQFVHRLGESAGYYRVRVNG